MRADELRIGLHQEALRRTRNDAEERIVGKRQVDIGNVDASAPPCLSTFRTVLTQKSLDLLTAFHYLFLSLSALSSCSD